MSILFFWGWELVIVTYNLWNKTPESIFQITRGQWGWYSINQARNQLGTPGGTKSFLRGAQIFWTMSNAFFQGSEKFSWVDFSPLVAGLQWIFNGSMIKKFYRCLFRYFHCYCFCSWQCRSSPILHPRNAYRGPPMVISKKIFRQCGTSRGQKPSQQIFFLLFYFIIF